MTTGAGKEALVTRLMTRGRVGNGVAALALIAVLVGYFLPWTNLNPSLSSLVGVNEAVAIKRGTGSGRGEAALRLGRGEVVSGRDWAKALDHIGEEASLDERQLRRLGIARLLVRLLPWATALLTVILLLLAVPPHRVLWLGPVAVLFRAAQSRLFSAFLLTLVLTCSLLVFVVGDILLASATLLGEADSRTGIGLYLLCGGGGLAFVAAFLGFGPGRIRALLVSAGLLVGLTVLAWLQTRG